MPWPWGKKQAEERVKAALRQRITSQQVETSPSAAAEPTAAPPPAVPAPPEPIAPAVLAMDEQEMAAAPEPQPVALTTPPRLPAAPPVAAPEMAPVVVSEAEPATPVVFDSDATAVVEPEAVEAALAGPEPAPTPPAPAAPAAPAVPHHRRRQRGMPMVIIGAYHGLDLTLFIGRKGRAIGFRERPLPVRPMTAVRPLGFFGRNLTWHVNQRQQRTELHQLSQLGRKPMSIWLALWIALRWIFSWRINVLIIERYIFGEAIGYFLLGTLAFTFFMIVTSIFSLGEKIFSKHIPPFTIAKVLILMAPQFLVLAIPVAVLFSTLMAMGRLNRDNEIVAMTTTGVSLYRLFVPFVVIGIIGGLMTWYTYENVVPQSNRACKEVLAVFWESQVVEFIKPQIVIKAPQKKYFVVDRINKNEGLMFNLRLYDYAGENDQQRKFPRIFIAQQAFVENEYLVLRNVRLYNIDAYNGNTLVSASMPEVKIDIGTKIRDFQYEVHPTEMQAQALRTRIQLYRDRLQSLGFSNSNLKSTYFRDWTEYYFKFAVPVTCLVFVLVAVPVSLRGPRDERNLGIILSFLLVMAYWILYFSCRVMGTRGPELARDLAVAGKVLLHKGANLFPPYVAGWLPATAFFVWGVLLILRARK